MARSRIANRILHRSHASATRTRQPSLRISSCRRCRRHTRRSIQRVACTSPRHSRYSGLSTSNEARTATAISPSTAMAGDSSPSSVRSVCMRPMWIANSVGDERHRPAAVGARAGLVRRPRLRRPARPPPLPRRAPAPGRPCRARRPSCRPARPRCPRRRRRSSPRRRSPPPRPRPRRPAPTASSSASAPSAQGRPARPAPAPCAPSRGTPLSRGGCPPPRTSPP